MDATRCYHQPWIYSATDNTAKWIPGPFIEPVQKLIESTFHHVRRSPVIEPKIKQKIDFKLNVWPFEVIFDDSLTMDQIHG